MATAVIYAWRDCRTCSLAGRAVMPLAFLLFHLTYGWATLAGCTLLLRTPQPRPTR
jgi:hypothetical protein